MKYYSITKCIKMQKEILRKYDKIIPTRLENEKSHDYLDNLSIQLTWDDDNRVFLQREEKEKYIYAILGYSIWYYISPICYYYKDSLPIIYLIYNEYLPKELHLEMLLNYNDNNKEDVVYRKIKNDIDDYKLNGYFTTKGNI